MNKFIFACFLAVFVHNTYAQMLGMGSGCGCGNSLGFNGLGLGPGLAPNYIPNSAGFNGLTLGGIPMTASPIGYGDVAVAGELPVGGNTAVAGNVPVIGYVMFEGCVPAGGLVSVANGCGCGCNGPLMY
ncbi:hypothetical protein K1T71_014167 [Dendrolimus kikuchii]|uniref:Uncharacterized protein n=1 Tax=Dendrolimus kikuchii TaxID=765133 RepID=A0ACC1CFA7_9NEOP|nr:hypothetical protein K1T71_014167 [Dendrolimus kikuchii]